MNILSLCVFQDKWLPRVLKKKDKLGIIACFGGSDDEGGRSLLHYARFKSPRSRGHFHTPCSQTLESINA